MKLIKGKYILRASLSDLVDGYTFTNDDRAAVLQPAADFLLNLSCDDIDRPINTTVSLISENRLNVLAARIITSGAPGLQRAIDASKAATILLVGRSEYDITSESLGGFTFGIDDFNEWQDVGVSFLPKKVNDNYYLSVDHAYSRITVDDYNLQSAYEGETFNAFLELMIDTAGVLDNGGNVV